MIFKGKLGEYLFVSNLVPGQINSFNQMLKTGLSIIWNTGKKATITVDGQPYLLNKNCVIFLTNFHSIQKIDFDNLKVIRFNRPFYCVENHDSDVGCRGLLFFGASSVPKIKLIEDHHQQFDLLWKIFLMEIDQTDDYSYEMLFALLKRFLILCVRIYKNEHYDFRQDTVQIGLIREFSYLVEKHFKTKTRVSDYADLLFKSPKTISNNFKKYIAESPLEIINNRRLLEAKRLLKYSSKTMFAIASELSFGDVQAFSNFIKKNTGQTPKAIRQG